MTCAFYGRPSQIETWERRAEAAAGPEGGGCSGRSRSPPPPSPESAVEKHLIRLCFFFHADGGASLRDEMTDGCHHCQRGPASTPLILRCLIPIFDNILPNHQIILTPLNKSEFVFVENKNWGSISKAHLLMRYFC